MSRYPAERHRGTGSGEHYDGDQQRPEQEEQPVLELEAALVLPCRSDELTYGRKNDCRGLAPGQQVEEDRNCGSGQAGQHPGVKKSNHAGRVGGVRASRSTTPNGVSVVTR